MELSGLSRARTPKPRAARGSLRKYTLLKDLIDIIDRTNTIDRTDIINRIDIINRTDIINCTDKIILMLLIILILFNCTNLNTNTIEC